MTRLFAWFPQGGRLEVEIPDDYDVAEWLHQVIDHPSVEWIKLRDGSYANRSQIVRLEVAVTEDHVVVMQPAPGG